MSLMPLGDNLSSVLPFLAALKKSVPDFSGMTSDDAAPPPEPNIPPPPLQVPQQPQPAPQVSQQQPGDVSGIGDLAQPSQTQAPKFQETKGHMLMRLLQAGVQGGLNGMAANAQTYAQTGRNAGFGGGFGGAEMMPFTLAQRGQQLQMGQAQIDLLKQQAQNINVPGYGSMPAGLAKVLFPSLIRGQATTQAAQIGAQGRTGAAQIGADARIKAAQMGLGPIADVPQDLQDQFGLPAQLPLKMLNQAESAANKPLTVVAGANDSYVANKQTGAKTPLGVGNRGAGAALARPVQVADPNNPGNITYQSAGQAMQQGSMAPSSAPAVTAKATARAVAPGGKVGEEINAFNTALQHADLLQNSAEALHNGDIQALNSLKNKFSNAFGASGPITANTIAQAYTREISKMLSSGHMTDSEIGAVGSTLDPNRQSLPQMMGVLQAYKALAQSKMNVRQQGVQQGMQGKPNFPAAQEPTATGPNGHKIVFRNGAWVDAAPVQPIQ